MAPLDSFTLPRLQITTPVPHHLFTIYINLHHSSLSDLVFPWTRRMYLDPYMFHLPAILAFRSRSLNLLSSSLTLIHICHQGSSSSLPVKDKTVILQLSSIPFSSLCSTHHLSAGFCASVHNKLQLHYNVPSP